MDTLAPLKQLNGPEATQRGPGSLPGWSPLPWLAGQKESMAVAEWVPLVDISESEEDYLIQAELPGVKKGGVQVIVEESTLTITGKREFEIEGMSKKRFRTERTYGSFGRRFSLPDDANPAKVSTQFIDGVFTVSLAKKEKNKPPQEEVVDEITVWWQKALGTKAVLGQASNRPSLGQRAPLPELLWTKPDSGHAQQEKNVAEVIPSAIDKKGTRGPGTQERKGPSSSRSLSTLGRLKQWSGVVVSSTVFFLVVMFLRSVVAVFETIRWALGILTVEFRRVRHWPHRFKDFLLRVKPLPAGNNS